MQVEKALSCVRTPDPSAMRETQCRLDSIIKPLGSLGVMESHLVRIAGMTGSHRFDFSKKGAVVFCADNGVVRRGITQSTQEVTAIVAENLTTGDTCLCAMARVAGAKVIPVDIGIATDLRLPGLLARKIAYGTGDISSGPAMTRDQAMGALEVGIDLAIALHRDGYRLLSAGEMGIGNTAIGAAVTSALLGLPASETVGRGAGLSDKGLERKIQVVQSALELHRPDPGDPLSILQSLGGFDIAGMAGLCIGGAVAGLPVVLDGFISNVSALLACRLCPGVRHFILPSHLSAEPAAALVMRELELEPPLRAGLRLGEGTGAVATFPLYDMMLEIYSSMVTFDDENMEAYQPL